jgi:hypothetical protein
MDRTTERVTTMSSFDSQQHSTQVPPASRTPKVPRIRLSVKKKTDASNNRNNDNHNATSPPQPTEETSLSQSILQNLREGNLDFAINEECTM